MEVSLNLIVICCTSQIVFPPNIGGLLSVDCLQLWTVCDSVTKAATISTAAFSVCFEKFLLVGLKIGQKVRNLLSSLKQQMLQIEQDCVFNGLVDQRCSVTLFVTTASTTYSVDIIFYILRHIVVYDVLDFREVETFRCDVSRYKDVFLTRPEFINSFTAFLLIFTSVRGHCQNAFEQKVFVNGVNILKFF